MFSFTCATCGSLHEGSPSLSFPWPYFYNEVPADKRGQRTFLNEDFCTIDEQYFFVRCCLQIPIHGVAEPFVWGVWSSLSEPNYRKYVAAFEDPNQSGRYFGWLSSRLPFYPDTLNLKMWVHVQPDGMRPLLELEESDHPLSRDFHGGISLKRAEQIYEASMHGA